MRKEQILKNDKGEKYKLTVITNEEGREIKYLDKLEEKEDDPFGDGGSKRHDTKRDPDNWGGW